MDMEEAEQGIKSNNDVGEPCSRLDRRAVSGSLVIKATASKKRALLPKRELGQPPQMHYSVFERKWVPVPVKKRVKNNNLELRF